MLIRKCPKCKKDITYSNKSKLKRAERDMSLCRSCGLKGISKGKGKKQTKEHVRKRAEALSRYKKGKTEVELYGKNKAEEISKKKSEALKGKNRPEFSEEWKQNMSKSRKESEVYKAWMNSEEYKNKRRAINAMRYYGMTLDEWYSMAEEKQLYYLKVKSITRSQDLKSLPDYEKRGHAKNNGYHLDHIYPISLGYINNIPAEEIAHISNLQYIPWKENILKSNKIIAQ
jgi:hypothetical protein